ncbi:MAG: Uma2 family endonuclease [Chloroflexota bacterium]
MNSVKELSTPALSNTNGEKGIAHPTPTFLEVLQNFQKYTQPHGHTHTAPINTNGTEPHSDAGIHIPEALFWAKYYEHVDFSYEWANGVLQERPPMAKVIQARQQQWLVSLVLAYLTYNPIAEVINLEVGFRFPTATGHATRKPDMGIILHTNPNAVHPDDRTVHGVCDLCIESLSDSDWNQIDRDINDKRLEYEYAGVQEYYILDSEEGRYMMFYELDPVTGRYREMNIGPDGIIRSSVLPGFQFRIRDLHECPVIRDLVDDPVYQGFIMREYQGERQRANQEAQRAETERQAREVAENENARLRALLEEHGISL